DRLKYDREIYIWIQDGAVEYRLPVTSIKWWFNHRCRWTGKRLTRPITRAEFEVPLPNLSNLRKYVRERDLAEIATARADGEKYRPAGDGEMILLDEARRISGLSKGQLMRAHWYGTRLISARKIWAEKMPAIGIDGRRQPQWHFNRREMEALAAAEVYTDPV